ncbi:hypothetical protein ACFYZI_23325 [Streptomyces griseorubiginosus]|nr:hypothetical protein [Streptomyces sp. BK205]
MKGPREGAVAGLRERRWRDQADEWWTDPVPGGRGAAQVVAEPRDLTP